MPKRDSTAQGREFGESLRAAIKRLGLTSRELAEKLVWDEAKLSCLVNGKGGVTQVELALLFGFCGFGLEEREHLFSLALSLNSKSWLQNHGACAPIHQRTFEENLRLAEELICWQAEVMPALVQSPAYMRAVLAASPNVSTDDLETHVAARLELQKLCGRQRVERGLTSTFYIHEFALHLPVGGRDVHTEQLHELLRLAVRPSITIRILPAVIGAHAGLGGPFLRLTFDSCEPLVCLQHENSSLFLEDGVQVEAYGAVVRSLDRSALDVDTSKALIADLGEKLSAL